MNVESLASLITSSFAIVSFFYIYFRDLASIKERLVAIETKITPFWNWIDKSLPIILKSPHTKEFDDLLEKYANKRDNMTSNELDRLISIVGDEINKTSKDKILLYVLMLNSLKVYVKDR